MGLPVGCSECDGDVESLTVQYWGLPEHDGLPQNCQLNNGERDHKFVYQNAPYLSYRLIFFVDCWCHFLPYSNATVWTTITGFNRNILYGSANKDVWYKDKDGWHWASSLWMISGRALNGDPQIAKTMGFPRGWVWDPQFLGQPLWLSLVCKERTRSWWWAAAVNAAAETCGAQNVEISGT